MIEEVLVFKGVKELTDKAYAECEEPVGLVLL